jgi:hypothetical protein
VAGPSPARVAFPHHIILGSACTELWDRKENPGKEKIVAVSHIGK